MTALNIPSQGAASPPSHGAQPLNGDRTPAGARDAQGNSAFDVLLGALSGSSGEPQSVPSGSNAGNPTTESSALQSLDAAGSAASWRSISVAHALGSGVLVALDKRFGGAAAAEQQTVGAKATKTNSESGADAVTLASAGLASLIGALTSGSAASPLVAASAPTAPNSASPSAALVLAARAGKDAVDATQTQDAMPSDAIRATPTRGGANAGAQPLEVTVVRAITYLGLDPTLKVAPGPARASALDAAAASASRAAGAPVAAPDAQNNSADMSNDDQSHRHAHGGEPYSLASAKAAHADQQAALAAVQATAPSAVSGAATVASLSNVPVAQLADVIANVATGLDSQGTAAQSNTTANAPSAGRAAPVKELDVQLNPASLGTVSIQMRLSKGNLSVTIQADKSDTLKLIENERDAISGKLKSLNFSVESVTVKASEPAASSNAGADATNTGTSTYGEPQQGQSGQATDDSHDGRFPRGGGDQRQPARARDDIAGDPGDGNFGHSVV
jgi:chemotaxis protein MotD